LWNTCGGLKKTILDNYQAKAKKAAGVKTAGLKIGAKNGT